MSAKAKSINLLLYDGTLDGVISIEDTSWNLGELYSAPRDSVMELLDTDACSKSGVYLLLSANKVYVGQSSDLSRRLSQHIASKDWWESAVILTTKDDSLTHSDIDYLESVLIEKAQESGRLDCDNSNKGNPRKVDKYRKVFLKQYLDEALFLMQLIGITVFVEGKAGVQVAPDQQGGVLEVGSVRMRLKLGSKAKGAAQTFLREQGIELVRNLNYASLRQETREFWLNPHVECLQEDWQLVLNDNVSDQLFVVSVPANDLSLGDEPGKGLLRRKDKPELIDLHISLDDKKDKASGVDFSKYEWRVVPY